MTDKAVKREFSFTDREAGIVARCELGVGVVRHRITRLIRESYRLHEQMFNSGLDMVVVARTRAKDADYYRIEGALLHLAGKAGIYDQKSNDMDD